jgi:ABC-type multidrug transport system fused ATPase/permease subunit
MQESSQRQFASGAQVFAIYFRHVRKYPFLLALVALGAIGIQVVDLAAPWYLRQFFNVLAANVPDGTAVSQLLELVAIIAAIYFVGWIIRRVQELCIILFEYL